VFSFDLLVKSLLNKWKLYGSKPFPVSSGIVLSTNVTVETTTVAIEVNAKI
jgi:hypothetical protein